MSTVSIRHIFGADELRRHAQAWNALWEASEVHTPAAKAEFVALWADQFHPQGGLEALVVEEDGRFVAALPFVVTSSRRFARLAKSPINDWGAFGDLLLDPRTTSEFALGALFRGLRDANVGWMSLNAIDLDSTRWNRAQDAAHGDAWYVHASFQFESPVTDINHDWQAYEAARCRDHVRNRKKNARAFLNAGGGELVLRTDCADGELSQLVERGFQVEDRSWKGRAGTSVLKSAGALRFYQDVARLAARQNHLFLAFLEHQARPIAFIYGWRARGTYFIVKIGHDEEYRQFGPGLLAVSQLLERLFADPSARRVDFCGAAERWSTRFSTRTRRLGRLALAPPGWTGAGISWGYRLLKPLARRMRALAKRD
jgi:CelD/BcsL family acetyltransferase involved in cellulose biosynthesis